MKNMSNAKNSERPPPEVCGASDFQRENASPSLTQMLNQRFKKIASWCKRRINDLRKSPVCANAESTI